jgi:1,4-dihydroxy-2-naphthoate octaprenyltransferase
MKAEEKKLINKNNQYYTRIIINKKNRTGLGIAVFIGIIVMSVLIFNQRMTGSHWLILGVPSLIVAILYILIPPTEEWEYIPWQGQATKQEQTFFR